MMMNEDKTPFTPKWSPVAFTCPNCRSNKIEEVLANVTVRSEVHLTEDLNDGELSYDTGPQERIKDANNEDGHVVRYQCGGCGALIVDDDSPYAENGLDHHALASALKALAATSPADSVPLITQEELIQRFSDALEETEGEALANLWNEMSPNQVVYEGDSMFRWVE
jgi:predicted RNA-binding Zn-ribbon protein involved in translation (DUF1610 family)